MFIGKKNKVHATLHPLSKTTQQADHKQLSKILQQVSGQLDLMLELQQQQQAKNSYDLSDPCNMDTIDEHDQYDRLQQYQDQCQYLHQRQPQDSCHVNPHQSNLYRNNNNSNTRILHQKCHQQSSVSPSLSSFFSSGHQPQNQCMSTCIHQSYHPCHHHYYQPSCRHTSFQPQCSNSVFHGNQQFHYQPQHYYHHCTALGHGSCSCTHTDIPTAIASPQSTRISRPVKNMNASDPIKHTTNPALDTKVSFGQSGYCRNNNTYSTTYPLSIGSTTTPTTTTAAASTRTKFDKSHNHPPFPGLNTYSMNTETDTTTPTSDYCNNNDIDNDDEQQQRRHRRRQLLQKHSTSPPLTKTLPSSSPSPPPLFPLRTENLSGHYHHHHHRQQQQQQQQQLSWTEIYRQDLLSRHDALISPPASSCNNINAVYMNKVKKTKSNQSHHLRGWWIHGKYKWNQLRKKKFNFCFT